MLECMTDPEDVLEYLDETVKKFHVRQLLVWLKAFTGGEAQTFPVLQVSLRTRYLALLPQF